MTVWEEIRENIVYWLRNRRHADGPTMVPLHEFAREMSLRLNFETRYYLLTKETGRTIPVEEARAWLLDNDTGKKLTRMHATLLPDAYEPLIAPEF